jgi:hypothetical protein
MGLCDAIIKRWQFSKKSRVARSKAGVRDRFICVHLRHLRINALSADERRGASYKYSQTLSNEISCCASIGLVM